MSSKKRSLAQRILVSAQIPEDLSGSALLFQVTGRQEAYIENYKGILEYTDSRILLLGKHCRLSIEGKHLMIPFYTAEEMKITGQIEHISYL